VNRGVSADLSMGECGSLDTTVIGPIYPCSRGIGNRRGQHDEKTTYLAQTDDGMERPTATPDDDDTSVSRCQSSVRITGDLGKTRHIWLLDTFFVGSNVDFPI
jgi:hypothetical protein